MPRAQKSTGRLNPFVLSWTDAMHDTFIDALENQHDLGKRSDTGFKPEAWAYCVTRVQDVYAGKEAIPVEKLKNKLDHVCIFYLIPYYLRILNNLLVENVACENPVSPYVDKSILQMPQMWVPAYETALGIVVDFRSEPVVPTVLQSKPKSDNGFL